MNSKLQKPTILRTHGSQFELYCSKSSGQELRKWTIKQFPLIKKSWSLVANISTGNIKDHLIGQAKNQPTFSPKLQQVCNAHHHGYFHNLKSLPQPLRHTYICTHSPACPTSPFKFSLTSLTHFRVRKRVWWTVYKLCLTSLQSRCSILSHDTLHHCLSSNSSLQNGERELGRLHRYCTVKTPTILHKERAHSTTGSALLEIWLCHPADSIPVRHSLYTQLTRPFPFFAEVGRACETISSSPTQLGPPRCAHILTTTFLKMPFSFCGNFWFPEDMLVW